MHCKTKKSRSSRAGRVSPLPAWMTNAIYPRLLCVAALVSNAS